jgi:hypothetical protein
VVWCVGHAEHRSTEVAPNVACAEHMCGCCLLTAWDMYVCLVPSSTLVRPSRNCMVRQKPQPEQLLLCCCRVDQRAAQQNRNTCVVRQAAVSHPGTLHCYTHWSAKLSACMSSHWLPPGSSGGLVLNPGNLQQQGQQQQQHGGQRQGQQQSGWMSVTRELQWATQQGAWMCHQMHGIAAAAAAAAAPYSLDKT